MEIALDFIYKGISYADKVLVHGLKTSWKKGKKESLEPYTMTGIEAFFN